MAKERVPKAIVNCEFCGRDTINKCKICKTCMRRAALPEPEDLDSMDELHPDVCRDDVVWGEVNDAIRDLTE